MGPSGKSIIQTAPGFLSKCPVPIVTVTVSVTYHLLRTAVHEEGLINVAFSIRMNTEGGTMCCLVKNSQKNSRDFKEKKPKEVCKLAC